MKVSICMPVYNQARIVASSVWNAICQDYPDKEVIVIDDCSTDRTFEICKTEVSEFYPPIVYRNEKNLGLAKNLGECVKKASGEIIVFLCGDDYFTHSSVVSDMVKIFEDPKVGVVGRYYYQYLDKFPGAVMTIRSGLPSFCQPSGIGFRKLCLEGLEFSPKLFVEVPSMVKQIIDNNWRCQIIQYDTIAARLHPGPKGNAATSPLYYKSHSQSPTLNWFELTGKPIGMYLGLIQIKNRASWMLWREIKITIKLNWKCLLNPGFWLCALTALIVPGWILRPLANFYRHRITRHFVKVIER